MKSTALLGMGLLAASMMVGCGDDGSSTDPCTVDAGPPVADSICAALQPDPGQVLAVGSLCCARQDNSASLTDYTLRLTALSLSSPSTLASPVVESLLNRSLDLEGFNWLINVQGTGGDGAVTIETGFGLRESSGGNSTYHFYDHATDSSSITGGGSMQWEPVSVAGNQTSNNIVSNAAPQSFTVPVFNEAALLESGELVVDLELPLQALQLDSMNSGADGTCVGDRDGCVMDACGDEVCTGFDTSRASVTTYIGVAEADMAVIQVPPLDGVSLCALISNNLNTAGCTLPATRCCADPDPTNWPASATVLPDSLCTGMGVCTKDPGNQSVCGGAMPACNAWELKGNFSAHGVGLTTP